MSDNGEVHFENGWEKAQREAAGQPVKGTHPAEAPVVEEKPAVDPAHDAEVGLLHKLESEVTALAQKLGVA